MNPVNASTDNRFDTQITMPEYNVRLRSKSGQSTIKNLTDESTLFDLCSEVSRLTSLDVADLKLMLGFPPMPLCLDDLSVCLSDAGVRAGDTLVAQCNHRATLERTRNDDSRLVEHLCGNGGVSGFLVRRVVDADNSCLFSSFNLVMRLQRDAYTTREEIARVVNSDRQTYNSGMLGRDNAEYCAWILVESSWGGAIELSVLTLLYGVEICVIDTRAIRINRFGEDRNYDTRILLIYDG